MFKLIKTDLTFSRNGTSIGEKKFSLLLQENQEMTNIIPPFIRTVKKEKLLTLNF